MVLQTCADQMAGPGPASRDIRLELGYPIIVLDRHTTKRRFKGQV
jgi:hypothetical protein